MIKIELYECEFCNKHLKTLQGINKHEDNCSKNLKAIKAKNALSCVNKEIDNIRLNATSVPDLFERIESFLYSKGIQVNFTNIPENWSDKIKNSHDGPMDRETYPQNWDPRSNPGRPTGYPGWIGDITANNFKILDRSIINIKTKKIDRLSDIWGGWSNSLFKFPYINTSNIQCKLFIYDFPKMQAEWEIKGGRATQLKEQYSTNVREFTQKFNNERTSYIENKSDVQTAKSKLQELQQMQIEVQTVIKNLKNKHHEDFNNNYSLETPKVDSIYVDIEEYQKFKNNTTKVRLTDIDELVKQYEVIEESLDSYRDYTHSHSEIFI